MGRWGADRSSAEGSKMREPLQVLAISALFLMMGCSYGHMLSRDETPQVAADQGFIAFAADVNQRMTFTLCRDADMSNCLDFTALEPGEPAVAVSQVPAGRYCLITIAAEDPSGGMGMVRHFEGETTSCFDVEPAAIAYPGHLVFRVKETASSMAYVESGWEKRSSIEADVRSIYPRLAGYPIRVVRTRSLR